MLVRYLTMFEPDYNGPPSIHERETSNEIRNSLPSSGGRAYPVALAISDLRSTSWKISSWSRCQVVYEEEQRQKRLEGPWSRPSRRCNPSSSKRRRWKALGHHGFKLLIKKDFAFSILPDPVFVLIWNRVLSTQQQLPYSIIRLRAMDCLEKLSLKYFLTIFFENSTNTVALGFGVFEIF